MRRNYFFALLTLCLITYNGYSTTYTSAANGNWMNFMTWSPFGVPIPGDIVIINHAVTLDTSLVYTVGSITVNLGGSLIQNSPIRDIWMNGINASFTNHGTTTLRYIWLNAGSFTNTGTFNVKSVLNNITLNNSGSFIGVDSLYTNGTVNNNGTFNIMTFYNQNIMKNWGVIKGVVSVVDSMYNNGTFINYAGALLRADSATNAGTFTNDGTIEYNQFANITSGIFTNNNAFSFDDFFNFGNFTNSGVMIGTKSLWNNEVFANQSSGQITLGENFINADSISFTANFINNGSVMIGDSYYNFNSVSGANTGSFTVQDSSFNFGTMTGSFDFCDATPPPSYPYIDWNFGTIDATVTFCGLTEVKQNNSASFIVYPNPTTGIVNFGAQKQFVEVYNMEGKKVLEDYTHQINIEKFNSGLYYLMIKDIDGNQLYKEKLIKE